MTVAPQAPIETVVVPPGRRERALTIAIFLAAGCLLGVGVEVVARPGAAPSRAGAATLVAAARTFPSKPDEGRAQERRSESGASDNRGVQGTHHHAHHAGSAAPSATPRAAIASGPIDAGADADDFAAAVETLTKAKAEVTLP